jgi:hypothetical protein
MSSVLVRPINVLFFPTDERDNGQPKRLNEVDCYYDRLDLFKKTTVLINIMIVGKEKINEKYF